MTAILDASRCFGHGSGVRVKLKELEHIFLLLSQYAPGQNTQRLFHNKSDEKYQFFTALIPKRALLSVLLTLVTLPLWDQVEGDTGYRGGPFTLFTQIQ